MKEHLNIHITGKVKQIDFLYYSQLFVQKHDLNGFIQNGSTTNVYVEAEGNPEELQKLVDFYKTGPLSKIIEDMRFEKGEMLDYKKFTVKKEKLPGIEKKGFFSRFKKKSK